MEQMLSNDYDDQDGAREIVQREQENERQTEEKRGKERERDRDRDEREGEPCRSLVKARSCVERGAQKRQQKEAKMNMGAKGWTSPGATQGSQWWRGWQGEGWGEGGSPLRGGTMSCMPQHPKVVLCTGPGARGAQKMLAGMTLNTSRSEGASCPWPPGSHARLPRLPAQLLLQGLQLLFLLLQQLLLVPDLLLGFLEPMSEALGVGEGERREKEA